MSHDRRLHPATDQHLPSADDTGYLKQTSHEHERTTGQSWYSYAAYDERQPGFTDDPWSPLNATSVYVSPQEPWSLERGHSPLPSVLDLETSSSALQYTNDVAIDQQDLYPPLFADEEDWSGNVSNPASQAILQHDFTWGETSVPTVRPPDSAQSAFGLPDNGYQLTPQADSNRCSAETLNQEPPRLYYVTQRHPALLQGSEVFVTPNSAQQLGDNEDVGSFGHMRPMDIPASDCYSVATYEPSSPPEVFCDTDGCVATFSGTYRKGNLARHRRLKHKGPAVYACEHYHCDRVFQRQDARTKHYRRHHPQLAPECKAKADQNRSRYRINTSDQNESKKHALLSSTITLQRANRDEGTSYMDTTLSTPTLEARIPSIEVTRNDGESIRCDICQKEFKRAAELRRHKDSVHSQNPQQYFCKVPGCDRASRSFPRKDKLADHTARVHGQSTTSEALKHGEEVSEATHRCGYEGCKREFDQRADLLRHQRTHTDESERPHKCAQCEKSFLYPKDLKRHQATHLDNKDDDKPSFHCEVASCEYGPGKQGFSRKDGMIRHMRRFHPEVIVEKEEV
ncbi:unnamed protein product [Alternaria alternata]